MTWIDTVPYEAANGRLRKIYDRITGPDKNIDNIMWCTACVALERN